VIRICLALVCLLTAVPAAAQDLSKHFQGLDGTFVVLDGQTGTFTRWNAARADQRFAPCSTFKIPNTAILLETKVATDADFVVTYDPALKASREVWRQDHTLRSAYKESVLWYYHALARKAGLPAVGRLVTQFGYGNADTSGGVAGDRPFWIDGTLRISAKASMARVSRSTAMTLRAPCVRSARVSPPGPGPTSTTVMPSSGPAARAIRPVRLRSSRKFWPSDFFADNPWRRITSRSGGRPSAPALSVMGRGRGRRAPSSGQPT